jgi:serine/threonine protein kinase
VQLLDFGLVKMALKEADFLAKTWTWIPYQEYQIAPELVDKLSREDRDDELAELSGEQHVSLSHDVRVEHLWKFGVLIYDLLHGYSPWETPEWHPDLGGLRNWTQMPRGYSDKDPREDLLKRRDRIVNEELPIDEHLSQDCVDVLRAMFTKDPQKRPTLRELCSFPWFQGQWVDEGPFTRPSRNIKKPTRSDSDQGRKVSEQFHEYFPSLNRFRNLKN